jgi:Holliday junction resolvase-like predicted endonuclease
MKKYTRQQTIDDLYRELKTISNLYQADCIKRTGTTSDTNESYSEVIANELLLKIEEFDKISKLRRGASYYIKEHNLFTFDLNLLHVEEKDFAKRITGLHLPEIGMILDYEVPLRNTNNDEKVGDIDLIAFNDKTKTLNLIELKVSNNQETLLRAILQSFTYFKQVDQPKLVRDFISDCKVIRAKALKEISPDDIKIVPSVLVTAKCNPFDELKEMELGTRPKLKALSSALGVNLFKIAIEVS